MSVSDLSLDGPDRQEQGRSRLSIGTLMQRMWIRAQLNSPALVQERIVPALHDAKEVGRLLARPNLPAYRLEGANGNGPLAIDYVGSGFARPFAEMLFFDEKPRARQIGTVSFWQRAALTAGSADARMVSSSWRLIRSLPRENALVLPEFVYHELDLGGSWEDVQRRFHTSVRRNELRLARRYDYSYKVSRSREDLERFYRHMYLPTMANRHGDDADPVSLSESYEYLSQGGLFMLKREGRWVSSVLVYGMQGTLRLRTMGVLNGDQELIADGAVGAMYCLCLQWAHENGYRAASFLGTKPCLSSGLFQYKRKWGAAIRVPSTLHRQVWLQIQRLTPAIVDRLKQNSLVVVGEDRSLHGLITVDSMAQVTEETKEFWAKRYMTPGLKSLRVYTVDQFAAGEVGTVSPRLVIPAEPGSSGA